MTPLAVVTRPRQLLAIAAAQPSLRRGGAVVVLTGILCLAAQVVAVLVGGGGAAAMAVSLSTPVFLVLFWLLSGFVVGAGARLMAWEPRRRELLAVTGLTYPVLVLYAVVGLVQAASPHLGGATLSTAAGLFALPVVAWFVALNALAAAAVYRDSPMAATAIALLPYAVLSGLLLIAIVVLSALHAAGVV